jgi:hypothetical protein
MYTNINYQRLPRAADKKTINAHFITSHPFYEVTFDVYNHRPTELMKAKLKAQSLLINLHHQRTDAAPHTRARKKRVTGTKR